MPGSFDEDSEALQLWVNLPAKLKMCEPAYQEFKKETIPTVTKNGVTAKVISGEALEVTVYFLKNNLLTFFQFSFKRIIVF